MAAFRARLVKSAAAKVAKKGTRVDTVKQASIEKFVSGTSSLGDTSASNSPHDQPEKKRRRVAQSSSPDDQHISVLEEKFTVPPCYLEGKMFEGENSVVVPDKEAEAILSADSTMMRKMLCRDAAAMMRVLETALVLNDTDTVPFADFKAMNDKVIELDLCNAELENRLLSLSGEYDNKVKLLKELNGIRTQKEATDEENQRLRDRITELEGSTAVGEDETDDEKSMKTRGDLIGKIRVLQEDILVAVEFGFKNATDQVMALNPDVNLITEGMGPLNQVVDGVIVPAEIPAAEEDQIEEAQTEV